MKCRSSPEICNARRVSSPGAARRNARPFSIFVRASMRTPSADRKSTRLNSSHVAISYAVFCLKKKKDIAVLEFKLLLSIVSIGDHVIIRHTTEICFSCDGYIWCEQLTCTLLLLVHPSTGQDN